MSYQWTLTYNPKYNALIYLITVFDFGYFMICIRRNVFVNCFANNIDVYIIFFELYVMGYIIIVFDFLEKIGWF